MAIPGPGVAISMNTIAGEFGGTVPHSLSEYYRGGGRVPNTPTNSNIATSGAINMGSFYGAMNRAQISLNLSSNTYNYDVYANRGPSYVAGSSDITVTVPSSVVVGSTSTGAYAMLVPSSFNPGDTVTIVNNGVIQGMGGAGGNGSPAALGKSAPQNVGQNGSSGGNALYVNRPTTVTNNGTIASGGGGGGGGCATSGLNSKYAAYNSGGGGGGGGAGFNGGAAGAGGSITPTANGAAGSPGGAGTSASGGGGGARGFVGPITRSTNGGSGGGRGASGSGAGASGGDPYFTGSSSGTSGGGTGYYVVGNPFITWPSFGTRQGGVS